MSSEADEFEKYIIQEGMKEVKNATEDAERLLKENVDSQVYSVYTPNTYRRTHALKSSIKNKIDKTGGMVYFDENEMDYTSAVTGENVNKYVPKWVDQGHKDSSGIDNMHHTYKGRNFIDKTIKELEQKYGKDCAKKIDE